MSYADKQKQKHLNRACSFCNWKNIKQEEDCRWLDDDDYCFVILAKNPKVSGHTLVVSKRPLDDITYLSPKSCEFISIMSKVVEWSKALKRHTNGGKVYVMTICEHWEPKEIDSNWQNGKQHPTTTEHLHFHLLPRYKDKRKKELAGENYFTRPEDEEWSKDRFESMKSQLKKAFELQNRSTHL